MSRAEEPRRFDRRRMLGLLALAAAAGCAPTGTGGVTAAVPAGASGAIRREVVDDPAERSLLTANGIVRSDIRSSFGGLTGTADGVPLTVELTITDVAGAALTGAAVYLWHCDRVGAFSLYDVPDQNWLRGVQVVDPAGKVGFTSVFPGAPAGRWPHLNIEVYPGLPALTGGAALVTTQLALPEDTCVEVYATPGYEPSVRNLAATPLGADPVFADGWDTQLLTVVGTATDGLTATLLVPVAT